MSIILFLFIVIIPLLTMKLVSEERKMRTDQLIMTAPITLADIVFGKYFAALALFIIAESVVFIYSIIIALCGMMTEIIQRFFMPYNFGQKTIPIRLRIIMDIRIYSCYKRSNPNTLTYKA